MGTPDRAPGIRLVTDPPQRADYAIRDEQSLILLWPITDEAVAWVNEHLPEDRITWGGATVIERRFFPAIFAGLAEDGLVGKVR
jgi:hypothetical protein